MAGYVLLELESMQTKVVNSLHSQQAQGLLIHAIFMRVILTIIIVLAFFNGIGQTPVRELKIPEAGWTLFIPTDSKFLTTGQFDTIKRKAVDALNNAYGTSAEDFDEVKPLFTIRQGQFNIFGSTRNPYDSSLFDTWKESYEVSKLMIIDLFKQQGPDLKVTDTASSTEIIDGLSFEKFYIKTFYPKRNLTMKTYWYCRKYGNYDLSINISYTDESIGKNYLDILRNSKFEK